MTQTLDPYFILDGTPARISELGQLIRKLDTDKMYKVEVKRYRATRSLAQNNLYWAWIKLLCVTHGFDPNDETEKNHVSDSIKKKFIGFKELVDPITGEIKEVANSSSRLDTANFADLLNNMEAHQEELLGPGGKFPQPHDYHLAMQQTHEDLRAGK